MASYLPAYLSICFFHVLIWVFSAIYLLHLLQVYTCVYIYIHIHIYIYMYTEIYRYRYKPVNTYMLSEGANRYEYPHIYVYIYIISKHACIWLDGMGWDGMGWDGCMCACTYV